MVFPCDLGESSNYHSLRKSRGLGAAPLCPCCALWVRMTPLLTASLNVFYIAQGDQRLNGQSFNPQHFEKSGWVSIAHGSLHTLAGTKEPIAANLSHKTIGHKTFSIHLTSSGWKHTLWITMAFSAPLAEKAQCLNPAAAYPVWKPTSRCDLSGAPQGQNGRAGQEIKERESTQPLAWTSMESVNFYHLGQTTLFVTVRGRKICNC